MTKKRSRFKYEAVLSVILLCVLSCFCGCESRTNTSAGSLNEKSLRSDRPDEPKLAVLWTSGDPEVAHKVCFMYTHNAKKRGWFDTVQLIVWGPSSKLLAEDQQLQEAVKKMMADGVEVKACKACADLYGVTDTLKSLGIEVKYMGVPLTNMLKSTDWRVITF